MIATLHRNSEKEATLRRRRLPHARNPPKANHTQSLYNYPGQNIHLKARPTTPTLRSARSPSNPAPQKRLVRSPGLTSSADWTIPRLGRSWQNRYARPTAWRIYRLPELLEAIKGNDREIWIVTDERCVDAVLALPDTDFSKDGKVPVTCLFGDYRGKPGKCDLAPLPSPNANPAPLFWELYA